MSLRSPRRVPIRLSPQIPDAPISPEEALKLYGHILSPFELTEILNYSSIFFVGLHPRKVVFDRNNKHNYGFDDLSENYKLVIGDHLCYRYEILGHISTSLYGHTVRCLDHSRNREVVVKICANSSEMIEHSKNELCVHAILCSIQGSHIVKPLDFFVFRRHICITFEPLGMNLSSFISFENTPAKSVVKSIAEQLLLALIDIRRFGISHNNIRPENVVVSNVSPIEIKLVDFANASCKGKQPPNFAHLSLYYRPPELILGGKVPETIDIWGFGVVIAEVAAGKKIFQGRDESDVVRKMCAAIGLPTPEYLGKISRSAEFFDEKGQPIIPEDDTTEYESLDKLVGSDDAGFLDFLRKILSWDPDSRLKPEDAIKHPWLSGQKQ